MKKNAKDSALQKASKTREERLKEALKANLQRRKSQTRARAADTGSKEQ